MDNQYNHLNPNQQVKIVSHLYIHLDNNPILDHID